MMHQLKDAMRKICTARKCDCDAGRWIGLDCELLRCLFDFLIPHPSSHTGGNNNKMVCDCVTANADM